MLRQAVLASAASLSTSMRGQLPSRRLPRGERVRAACATPCTSLSFSLETVKPYQIRPAVCCMRFSARYPLMKAVHIPLVAALPCGFRQKMSALTSYLQSDR